MNRPAWTRVRSDARKFGVALLGLLATAAAIADQAAGTNVLPPELARWAPVVVAVATALGVYKVRNTTQLAPPPPPVETYREAVATIAPAYLLGHRDAIAGVDRQMAEKRAQDWTERARNSGVHPIYAIPSTDSTAMRAMAWRRLVELKPEERTLDLWQAVLGSDVVELLRRTGGWVAPGTGRRSVVTPPDQRGPSDL